MAIPIGSQGSKQVNNSRPEVVECFGVLKDAEDPKKTDLVTEVSISVFLHQNESIIINGHTLSLDGAAVPQTLTPTGMMNLPPAEEKLVYQNPRGSPILTNT